ncbi:MAG: dihydrofolate reductase family protein [Candidatus Dormibacteria bacterium]
MSRLRCHIAVSVDGYAAGPNQSMENPLGEGGMQLHEWVFPLAVWRELQGMEGGGVNASTAVVEETLANIGAGVMGRNMFGPPAGGDWGDEPWNGWWGGDPPYHNDVFVLTHHPREAVEMEGGTTFRFVTDGIEAALERAKTAAGGQDVRLWGGAQVVREYLAAGLLDELELHIAPVLLGGGERLLENLPVAAIQLEQVRTLEAPGVTHVKYAVHRR